MSPLQAGAREGVDNTDRAKMPKSLIVGGWWMAEVIDGVTKEEPNDGVVEGKEEQEAEMKGFKYSRSSGTTGQSCVSQTLFQPVSNDQTSHGRRNLNPATSLALPSHHQVLRRSRVPPTMAYKNKDRKHNGTRKKRHSPPKNSECCQYRRRYSKLTALLA